MVIEKSTEKTNHARSRFVLHTTYYVSKFISIRKSGFPHSFSSVSLAFPQLLYHNHLFYANVRKEKAGSDQVMIQGIHGCLDTLKSSSILCLAAASLLSIKTLPFHELLQCSALHLSQDREWH